MSDVATAMHLHDETKAKVSASAEQAFALVDDRLRMRGCGRTETKSPRMAVPAGRRGEQARSRSRLAPRALEARLWQAAKGESTTGRRQSGAVPHFKYWPTHRRAEAVERSR